MHVYIRIKTCIHVYIIHAYIIHTYIVHTYIIHTYIHTYMRAYMCPSIHAGLVRVYYSLRFGV